MERVQIFVDGGNFYHLVLKKLSVEENAFDFEKLAEVLLDGRELGESGKRFYKGSVPEREGDERSKKLMSEQTKLFTMLKKADWEIKTSKLRRRIEEVIIDDRTVDFEKLKKLGVQKIQVERMREKGIDVKIATDLIVGAIDDKYDTAILVSSDSDLVPAIDWIRSRLKKKVEYIGFSIPDEKDETRSTKPLYLMFKKTDVQRVFSDIDVKKMHRV